MKRHSLFNIMARCWAFFTTRFMLGITDDEFQSKVLDTTEKTQKSVGELATAQTEQKSQIDTLVENYDQLEKSTKDAFEDLTRAKDTINDQDVLLKKVNRVLGSLKQEQRMAFGDPVARILADEENKARLNAAFRSAVSQNGDQAGTIKAITKALGEDSSPGSTLINDALFNEIYTALASYGVFSTFDLKNLGTKVTKFPIKTARPVANFILTEGGTISDDTNKAGGSVSLTVEVIGVLLNVSMQLIEDSEFDIASDVLADFMEAFAYRLDWACLQANGGADATDGGMSGVFDGATTVAAAAGNVTVEQTDLEDWINLILGVDASVLTRQARHWMNPQMLVRMLGVKDSNGRPIFLTATEAPTPAGIGSILGYPVTLAHAAPSTNAADALVSVFGDPKAYVVGLRKDFDFDASDQHKWDTYQRSFRGVGRAGTKMRKASAMSVLTLPSE